MAQDVEGAVGKTANNNGIPEMGEADGLSRPAEHEQETPLTRAQRAGARLVGAVKESDKLGMDFVAYGAVVIMSDHKALLDKCEAEGLKRRSRSKLKFLMEFDYLSGLSNLQAGPDLSEVSLDELKSRVFYCARQAEALIWLARKEKLKITGAEEDFQTLSDEREKAGGVKKLMDAYAKVKKPKKKRPPPKTNQTTTYKDVLTAVTSGYASRSPKTSITIGEAPGKVGDLTILLARKVSAEQTDVHEALRLPASGMKTLLKLATNLPVSDDPALNVFADLLHVGAIAFPKDIIEISKDDENGKTVKTKRDDCRQILLRPKADEAWISRRFSQAPIAVRVNRIKALPGLPTEDAYIFTKHRESVDSLVNRFDRQLFSIEAAAHEYDAKWAAKLVLSQNGGGTTYPVHLHEAAIHNVDIRIPDLTGVNWDWSFTLGKDTLANVWNSHVEAFGAKLKPTERSVVQIGGRDKTVGFKFQSFGEVALDAESSDIGNDKKNAWLNGDDLVRIIDAVNHLDLSGSVTFAVDNGGLVCVSAKASTAEYEFYAPTADGPNAQVRDAHYRSAHRLFYAELKAEEDAA